MLIAKGLKHAENYLHCEREGMNCLNPPPSKLCLGLPSKAGSFLNISSFTLLSDQEQAGMTRLRTRLKTETRKRISFKLEGVKHLMAQEEDAKLTLYLVNRLV